MIQRGKNPEQPNAKVPVNSTAISNLQIFTLWQYVPFVK